MPALRGSEAYSESGAGKIHAYDVASSTDATLATGLSDPEGLAIAGGQIYWADYGDGKIMTLPTTGAASPTVLVSGLNLPIAVAVDAQHIYWLDTGDNLVELANL
ncbi:MAG TPA: hypothetical protein VMB50_18585, partial [Myxococcales bacterium]|nr:hypothetical protein [Myxococcales bacterium]